ncbi:MAG: imidazoleglycerol-phosphate dehydratase HisB [Halobacteria archaeon]
MSDRKASVVRSTSETSVEVAVDIDGDGDVDADTGVGFLDHMIDGLGKHGFFDLQVACDGDVDETGDHHTVEDVGITLGSAFDEALDDREGIRRFADRKAPMDEAVSEVAVDVSGRPHTEIDLPLSEGEGQIGDMSAVMVEHFFDSFAKNMGLTLHLEVSGENNHHIAEAAFKGFALAMDDATRYDERRKGVPSTKGEI